MIGDYTLEHKLDGRELILLSKKDDKYICRYKDNNGVYIQDIFYENELNINQEEV